MVLPAAFRFREGWIGALEAHLGRGATNSTVTGLGEGGLFGRTPRGLLVERGLLEQVADGVDLARLHRLLRLRLRGRGIG